MPKLPHECYCGFAQGLGDTCVCGTDYYERKRDNFTFAVAMKLTSSAIVAEFISGKSIATLAKDWRISPESVEQVVREETKFLLRQL